MSARESKEPNYQAIALSYWQACSSQMISRHELAGRVDFHAMLPHHMDALVLRLTTYIASNPLYDLDIRYPETWWDAVKARFFPVWALKRWPARYVHHTVKASELATKVKLPERFGPVLFMDDVRIVTAELPEC